MKKEEFIARYGEDAWRKKLERDCAWREVHKEEVKANNKKYHKAHRAEENACSKKYNEEHPEQVIANHQELNRKGGKHYDWKLEYIHTGIQGARNKIRKKHNREFREIKATLAEEVELHHEWIGDTAEYRGMAFVEKVAHQHGIIDMILLLDGEITLLTEEEVKRGEKQIGRPTHQFN